ncbi:hypothetical protein AX14_009860, partial [Amanita brunnescens Koide BX004]
MAMNPPPNSGFFNSAHNFAVINGHFTEINIHVTPNSSDKPAPSPLLPMKHSSTMFTGHDEYLQRLRDYFNSSVEGKRKSFLLYGLGGIGKTQICLKFIEESVDLFSDIYWIDASSEITIELALMQIAQANFDTLPEAKQSAGHALQWISHQRTNWLVIYDGADGHYQTVEKYIPPGNGGYILITSRNVGLKRISLTSLKVLNMAEEEGVSLLLKSATLDGTSDYNSNLARQLASELGGIPLALDQAGAYMLASQCGIADYLGLYTRHNHELMSNPEFKGASDYDKTTYGTWDISMQKIERMAEQGAREEALSAQSAIKILRIFAFLDHANIPEELFKNAAENYIKRNLDVRLNVPLSIPLLDHQTLFLSEEGLWENLKFLAGIQILISFSLIETHSHLYSMHLLVHSWNRHRVPKAEIINLFHKARALLSCSIVLDHHTDNHAFCKLLAPHIRSNALYATELELKCIYNEDEYQRFALVLQCVGSQDEAEKLKVDIMNTRKAKFGPDHPSTLTSMANLACTYRDQGRWDEAEMLEVIVMNARKAKLQPDHPDTLTIMANLASTYMNQGRWDEAEKLEVDVMNESKAKFGPDHPDTLTSMANLACAYRNQGRWDEAEKLEVDVMNESKARLGPNHPDTLTSMANLASTYWNQGRWDEAEKLALDAMDVRKAKLGPDHPDTLTIMDNLASTYWVQGRWDEAEKLDLDV